MDKFIVVGDPNDKYTVTDDQRHGFAAQSHDKYVVTDTGVDAHSPLHKFAVADGSPESRMAEVKGARDKYAVLEDDNNNTAAQVEAQRAAPGGRAGWSMRKKLIVGGVILLVVLALAIGLGVGISQKKSSGGGSSAPDSSSGQQDDANDSKDDKDSSDSNGSAGSGGGNITDPTSPSQPGSWVPKIGDTFQMVISNPVRLDKDDKLTPAVDVYDIDLFDNTEETVSAIKDAGHHVLCYFSAGTWEDWRDDKDYFDKADLGKTLDDVQGEKYVNVSSPAVRNIMKGRISRAAKLGCNGIDAAFVDSFHSDSGFNLTLADAVSYVKFLSTEARAHNLAVGLKNGGDMVRTLLDWVDYSLNEACLRYDECGDYVPFIQAGKPVFNIEYPDGAPDKVSDAVRKALCAKRDIAADTRNFTTILKTEDLDGWVMYCDGKTYTTDVDSSSKKLLLQ